MILNLLIAISVNGIRTNPVNAQWAKAKDVAYIADRTDKQGVVAVTQNGEALIFDANGNRERSIPVDLDCRALSYQSSHADTSETLILGRRSIDAVSKEATEQFSNIFGQNKNTIIISSGCTILTKKSAFSLPRFDRWSAIATRSDGNTVAYIESPMNVPILAEYSYNGTEWSSAREMITPMIEGIGFAAPAPGFNDARYISDTKIVYIGNILTMQTASDNNLVKSLSPVFPNVELNLDKNPNEIVFLFMVDVRTRLTRIIIPLNIKDLPEIRYTRFGRMSVSFDNKFLYVLGDDSIARIELGILNSEKP